MYTVAILCTHVGKNLDFFFWEIAPRTLNALVEIPEEYFHIKQKSLMMLPEIHPDNFGHLKIFRFGPGRAKTNLSGPRAGSGKKIFCPGRAGPGRAKKICPGRAGVGQKQFCPGRAGSGLNNFFLPTGARGARGQLWSSEPFRRAVACNRTHFSKKKHRHFGAKHRSKGRTITKHAWYGRYDVK